MGADKAQQVQAAAVKAGGRGINKVLKRTKLCEYVKKNETCPFGENCAFAHSKTEVQDSPDLRKTKLCKAFKQGGCNNPNCNYAHGDEELRVPGVPEQTVCITPAQLPEKTVCVWFEKGVCSNGDKCIFSHGGIERANDSDDASHVSTKDTMSSSGSDGSSRRSSRRTKKREASDTPSTGASSEGASSEDEASPTDASPMEFVFPPPPGLEAQVAAVPPPPGLEHVIPRSPSANEKDTVRNALKQKMDELAQHSALLALQVSEVQLKLQQLEEDEPDQAKKEDEEKPMRTTLKLAEDEAFAKAVKPGRTALKKEAKAFTPSFMQGYSPQHAAFTESFNEYTAYDPAYQTYGMYSGQSW